jgi:hypothetical protein
MSWYNIRRLEYKLKQCDENAKIQLNLCNNGKYRAIRSHLRTINKLKDELVKYKETINQLNKKNGDTIRNLESINVKNSNCLSEKDQLNEELQKIQADYDIYIANCKSLENNLSIKNNTLSLSNDTLSSANDTLSSKNDTLSSSNIQLTDDNIKFSDKNKTLIDKNTDFNNTLSYYQGESLTLREEFQSDDGVNIKFTSNSINLVPKYRGTDTYYIFKSDQEDNYKLKITKDIIDATIYKYTSASTGVPATLETYIVDIPITHGDFTSYTNISNHLLNTTTPNETITNGLKNPITNVDFKSDDITSIFLSIPRINNIQSMYMTTQTLMENIDLDKNKILVMNSKLDIAMIIYNKYMNFMYFTVFFIITLVCLICYTLIYSIKDYKYLLYVAIILTILIYGIMNYVNVIETFDTITINEIENNNKIVKQILKDFKIYSQNDYDTLHSDLMKKTQKNNLIGILNDYNKKLFSFIYLLLIISIFALILLQLEIDLIVSGIITFVLFIIITLRFFFNIQKTNRTNFLKKYF